MARYYDMDKLKALIEAKADTLVEGKEAFLYVAKWLELLPHEDVVPKSEVAREIIAFVHQLIDMQNHECRWITTSGDEECVDVGYFVEGFEVVEKEILKKYTEGEG